MGSRRKPLKKDANNDDTRAFHGSLDFAELWDDFYLSVKPNGYPKYGSIRNFVGRQLWSDPHKDFMYWLLGPAEPRDAAMETKYPWALPQDWEEKRRTGGWYSEDSLKEFGKNIRGKIDALESLRAAGNGVTVNSLLRIERLMQQLDKDFQGRFFVDGLDLKENAARATLYIKLQERLLVMLDKAQDIYAKSHGINFHDMSGFEQLLAAQLLTKHAETSQSKGRQVMEQFIDMTLEKSMKYNTPLPEGLKETTLAVVRKDHTKKVLN
jgi:hypothetical protein